MSLPQILTPTTDEEETTFTIYYTNDTHGHIDADISFATLRGLVEQDTSAAAFLVDAGDSLSGSSFATLETGESPAELMHAMHYDVMAVGNHDFDYGFDRLKDLQTRYELPYLAANISSNASPLFDSTTIRDVAGHKIGFFCLTTPETATVTHPAKIEGIVFATPEVTIANAKTCVEALQDEGAELIVAVTHLGTASNNALNAQTLVEQVDGIDLLIDGHSHSVVPSVRINDTVITSTGSYMSNVGRATITIKGGECTVRSTLLGADDLVNVEPSAAISELLNSIRERESTVLQTVVGTSPVDLDGERSSVRSSSTNLGRLICASMIKDTGADFAIVNGGGIHTSIPAGDITRGMILDTLPFGNYTVSIKATGQQVIDALNTSMIVDNGSFPQLYGIEVLARPAQVKQADGSMADQYQVVSISLNGQALDPAQTYTVAINDFMHEGGDTYAVFIDCPVVIEGVATDVALLNYLSSEDITPVLDASNTLTLEAKVNSSLTVEESGQTTGVQAAA